MIPVDGKTQEARDPVWDVLTAREEGALASLREIVRGIRDMGLAADVNKVGEAIVAAGGSPAPGNDACAARRFAFCGANLSVRPAPGADGMIEVSFISNG
jgi:hypothetical protein